MKSDVQADILRVLRVFDERLDPSFPKIVPSVKKLTELDEKAVS